MEESKIEIVKYPKVKHVKMFVNKIQHVENHIHNDFELFVVLQGEGTIKYSAESCDFKTGDVIFINSGEVHSITYKIDSEAQKSNKRNEPLLLLIQVSNHFAIEYFPHIRATIFKTCKLNDVMDEETVQFIRILLLKAANAYFSGSECYQLEVIASMSKALATIYRCVDHEIVDEVQKLRIKRKRRRMERIISYIDENFDSQIRLEDIAEKENLSVTHLSHLFSSNFGMTFQEFVNIKRMEQCIRLMANQEKTLLEISYESGFSDSKYMNKMFLKEFGCTPKEYRKNYSLHDEEVVSETGKLEIIYNDENSAKTVDYYYNEEKKSNRIDIRFN